MRPTSLLLPVLLCACDRNGIVLDDTADADTDTDSDADTDVPPVDLWAGTVEMVVQADGAPFCHGEVQLGIDGVSLTGDGACGITEGPGAGQVLGLGFDGWVSGGGITGQVGFTLQGPGALPSVDMSGSVDEEHLDLGFELEVGPPDDPHAAQVMVGSVLATPAS